MKQIKKIIVYSVAAGVVIALLSGLIPVISNVLGVNYLGSPWPWIAQLSGGTSIIYANLFFDAVIWSIVVFTGYYLFEKTAPMK